MSKLIRPQDRCQLNSEIDGKLKFNNLVYELQVEQDFPATVIADQMAVCMYWQSIRDLFSEDDFEDC